MIAELWEPVAATPVCGVTVGYRGRTRRVLLKQESRNPTGSVKDRTALGLLRALDAAEPLRPGTVVVESTSGNLGIALAHLVARIGCRLIAVIDPKTPDASRHLLQAAGARLLLVDEPDGLGGYLLTRLRVVRELCAAHPEYRWTDQYSSPANPLIHEQTTGPEILAQGGPDLDAVYVAVSTGGTLAGIGAYTRRLNPAVRLVAVDAGFSVATSDCGDRSPAAARLTPASRLVPGIGASRPSSFLGPGSYDRRVAVADAPAIAMCRMFREDTGTGLGGSSGCVVTACVDGLRRPDAPRAPLCLIADDATKYESTIYDDGWLSSVEVLDDVKKTIDRYRTDGLTFSVDHRAARTKESA